MPANRWFPMLLLCCGALVGRDAAGQSASLLRRRTPVGPYTAEEVSLIKPPKPQPIRVHDLINIEVDEQIQQQVNALTNRRRQTAYELNFDDMLVLLSGLKIRADQTIRDQRPGIDIEALNNLRTISQFSRRDRLRLSIQAEIAEIRPNGTFVIEAHGSVAVNNEVNSYKLSGVIDPKDLDLRTRSVRSEKIGNKILVVDQVGPTRDSIKRGWFVRVIDMLTPF